MRSRIGISAAVLCVILNFNGAALALERGNLPAEGPKGFETDALNKFDRSTIIDNKWLPMTPGMRWVYEGSTVEDDGEEVPHRIEIYVTNLTKVINGVRTVVSYDLDYADGELEEAELAFYAQDNEGNVWRFGEYPEEYDNGKIVKAPAWIDGLAGARAGIMMHAEPRLGTPSYAQGWGPAVNWTDRGRVYRMGVKTFVPAGDYDDVLVIAESSQSEPDALQLKYYAPGVGNVRVGWTGAGEKTRETLELVKFEILGPSELAEIRAKALKLEQSAYRNRRNVYARTPASVGGSNDPVVKIPVGERPGVLRDTRSEDKGRLDRPREMAAKEISDDELMAIAVGALPGKAVDVAIEKKLGANRYVVEVLSTADGGAEVDVIIDMATYKVLAIDK